MGATIYGKMGVRPRLRELPRNGQCRHSGDEGVSKNTQKTAPQLKFWSLFLEHIVFLFCGPSVENLLKPMTNYGLNSGTLCVKLSD